MNSAELKEAINRLRAQIRDTGLESLWNNFVSTAINCWRSRNRTSIGEQQLPLYQALQAVDLKAYPFVQQRALASLNADSYFGAVMVSRIEQILRAENFDPEGSAQKLEILKNEVDRFFQLLSALDAVMCEGPQTAAKKDDTASLQILFSNEASVDSVSDLAECAKSWELILRAFGALYDIRTDDLKLISAHKASPLVLEVSAPMGLLGALGIACTLILHGLERYLKLKKAMEEIRSIQLSNKKIEQELETAQQAMRDELADEVAKRILKEQKIKKDGEVANSLKIAIDRLYQFIERGGEVSARVPEAVSNREEDKEGAKKIIEAFQEVKRIEREIEGRLLKG